MLIAVEGPDGAGKSTFVKLLAELIAKDSAEPDIVHCGPPKVWPVSEYELAVQDYQPGQGQNMIFDRLHVGEMVYGPIFRPGNTMSQNGYEHVTGVMAQKGLVTVFLMPGWDLLVKNISQRGDDMVQPDHVRQIQRGYQTMLDSYKLPRQTFFVYPNEHDAWRVIRLASSIEQMQTPTANFNSLVGWLYPQVLLVGQKTSDMAGVHKQAFVPWPGRSGDYLMTAVCQRYVTWAMMNCEEDDVVDVACAVKPQRVVALGAAATKDCTKKFVRHDKAPHPAYMLRFKSDVPAQEYAVML